MARKAAKAKDSESAQSVDDSNIAHTGHDKASAGSDSSEKAAARENEKDVGSLLAEMDRLTQELADERVRSGEIQTRYLRAVADLENFRKRSIREKEELSAHVTANLVEMLLPVIDNFQLGMQSAQQQPEAKGVADGFRMVLEQFFEVFKSIGVEAIIPDGKEFNPQFEECVSVLQHSEVPENHVIQTVRSGYRLKDRLIRAANVVVSSGNPDA